MYFAKPAGMVRVRPPKLRNALQVLVFVTICCIALLCQTRPRNPAPQSDLARQNMSRVGASTGQLVAILHRDPGIMVDVKRWIAQDATDHGQLIADADLTDEAIFTRLEADPNFRAIATVLVQKYGYLQPLVNPESALAKQQELLMQERVKGMALEEEADRARARQQQEQDLAVQRTPACDPRTNSRSPVYST